MSLVIVQDAEEDFLEAKREILLECTLHLYKNNHTPTPTDDVTDYTEANFDGYASQATGDWGAVYTNLSGKAETDTGVHTFLDTGSSTPNTIYGYYLTNPDGDLVLAEINPAGGFLMDAAGKTYSVLLRFTGVTE